eukprot:3940847-Rhodomonas_salina.10
MPVLLPQISVNDSRAVIGPMNVSTAATTVRAASINCTKPSINEKNTGINGGRPRGSSCVSPTGLAPPPAREKTRVRDSAAVRDR